MIAYFDKLYKGECSSFYEMLEKYINDSKRVMLVTANPEVLSRAERDEVLNKALLDKETIISPDGEGVVKAARMLDYSIWGKIAGVDTVQHMLEFCNREGKSVYFYGSKQNVLDSLEKKIKATLPNIRIEGLKNGYDYKSDDVFRDIKNASPDLILVALGVPKQELLIYKHFKDFDKGLFIGVGGSLDVLSGVKKRAPKILIKCKMEWFYRLLKEPKRITKFYHTHVTFLFKIQKMRKKKD